MDKVMIYHASINPLDMKNIDWNRGIHMGGKFSAYQAVERKLPDTFYLLSFQLDDQQFFDCEDQGNEDNWNEMIKEAKKDGKNIRYINRYEPDFTPSYLIFFPKLKLINSQKINSKELNYLYLMDSYL